MKNPAKPNDFAINPDGIGTFRFNRKSYGSQIKIDAVMARILGPNALVGARPGELPPGLDGTMLVHAKLVAFYSSLMVDCPPGWEDLEAIDLTEEPEKDKQILAVYIALMDKLDSFRLRPRVAGDGAAGQAGGAAAPQDPAVLGAGPLSDPAH